MHLFFAVNPEAVLSTCAQGLGREDVRCSKLLPRSSTVKKTDTNSYTRLISKYSVVWCRKPENEKQTNKQIDQKIRHTAQGLLSWSTFPAYLVVMFSLARKMVFSHRQASSLVSSFWSARNRLRTAAARAKAEHLRFASRVFISYFTSHNRKSCPQKPDYACTRQRIKEF